MASVLANEIAEIRADAKRFLGRKEETAASIVRRVANHRLVLIGEASHGTAEFYEMRAAITRELIQHGGFSAVIAEADWPDALQINRYIRNGDGAKDADTALAAFKRFPSWMWRNSEMRSFAEWLRNYNSTRPPENRCGFFGMDLYSLGASMQAVLNYLDKKDPAAARRARERYACFERFDKDPQWYGLATSGGGKESCEDEVIDQLLELQEQAVDLVHRNGAHSADEQFYAEQNARVVVSAEEYYRAMYRGSVMSWNLRDQHMSETVEALLDYQKHSRPDIVSRCVLWAHNSHLGDARATELGQTGELNVGQILRERFPGEVINIGFTTYTGTVTAAEEWDAPAETMQVRPALPESYESLFHETGLDRFWLDFRHDRRAASATRDERLERAIGVIYRPQTERASHYFHACLPRQFDLVIHMDKTTALKPLQRWSLHADSEDFPETYPEGQ